MNKILTIFFSNPLILNERKFLKFESQKKKKKETTSLNLTQRHDGFK